MDVRGLNTIYFDGTTISQWTDVNNVLRTAVLPCVRQEPVARFVLGYSTSILTANNGCCPNNNVVVNLLVAQGPSLDDVAIITNNDNYIET
jgi:hypothetical protein